MKKNRKSAKSERIFPQKKRQFRPQKTSRIQRELGFFCEKCGTFLIRSRQFSCRNDYLGDLPAPLEELQSPEEEKTTFFEKKTKFSLNSTRFLGSKVALSSRKNPLNFFEVSIFLRSPQIFCGLFRKRKLPLSTPKNESNLTRNRDIFEKMWFFPHPDCNSPFGAATLGILVSSYGRIAVRG